MPTEFQKFSLKPELIKALDEMKFIKPTPIQERTIPYIMQGFDVLGQAVTGSGKTLAFGLPILNNINDKIRKTQAVIISPTRELAIQIATELKKVARYTNIRILLIYGGVSYGPQEEGLRKGYHVIVATPGRMLDHLKRGARKYLRPKIVVLDEADKMLEMGFIEDVDKILYMIQQKEQQKLFFGATMPDRVYDLTKKYLKKPKFVSLIKEQKRQSRVPKEIKQYYFNVSDENGKLNAICKTLDFISSDYHDGKYKVLVFVRTKKRAEKLSRFLNEMGYQALAIHSDKSQLQREKIMKAFRNNAQLLIATDVASRGLDIQGITHVINYNMPQIHEDYIHRVGRCGRMGRKGVAITFIAPEEHRMLTEIEQLLNTRIAKLKIERYSMRGGIF
ncbi:MAG: DEAD/DEAH box helicase [Candidatus Helarchaeales archaeon]